MSGHFEGGTERTTEQYGVQAGLCKGVPGGREQALCSPSQEVRDAEDGHLSLLPTQVLSVVGSRSVFSYWSPLMGRSGT